MRIFIGIASYMRPAGLSQALEGVGLLQKPADAIIQVIVADNDPEGSALTTCETIREGYPFPLHYLKVEERGVSFARNKLADFAVNHHGDFLAFIDDDEFPDPNWLVELLAVQSTTEADLVGGPVCRIFPEGAPDWTRNICFFEMRKEKKGLTSRNLDSGNLLISTRVFSHHNLVFDNSFARTGGEDAMFSAQARAVGLTLAWSDKAMVYESVPADRLSIGWLAARSFRVGTVTIMLDKNHFGTLLAFFCSLGKALVYLSAGLVSGVASFGISPYQGRRCLIFMSRAAGLICGLFGARAKMSPSPGPLQS
ncbi:MAG: glycosyl transferase family 2 [Desulfuromonas sp.]|nr:MAG: glycosyl transferase family 2 [Desulfuromonas sp.]